MCIRDSCISAHFQIFASQFPDAFLVFHQKNSFRSAFYGLNVGAPVASALSFFVFNSRQINLEAGSAVGFAIHPDVAAALFHDSVYRRETKSSSLSFFLRRKEGFENVRLRFGVHTAAIVGNREHYVFAGRQHGRGPRIGGIQIDIRSLKMCIRDSACVAIACNCRPTSGKIEFSSASLSI